MTPAEHIAEAERLLNQAYGSIGGQDPDYARELVNKAVAHALITVAVELGAPHPPAPTGGEPGAQVAPAG